MDRKVFASLKRGLEQAIAIHKGDLAPARVVSMADVAAPDVAALRQRLGLSQEYFAAGIGVPVGTLRNWEQGIRTPKGPARILLHVLERDPRAVFNTVTAVREQSPGYRSTKAHAAPSKRRR